MELKPMNFLEYSALISWLVRSPSVMRMRPEDHKLLILSNSTDQTASGMTSHPGSSSGGVLEAETGKFLILDRCCAYEEGCLLMLEVN